MNTKLQFVHLVPHVWRPLCALPRTGWVKRGIKNPETVGTHTCSLRVLAVELMKDIPELTDDDKQRVLDMLEIHDWPEFDPRLGDIASPELGKNGNMTREQKDIFELKVMQHICEPLGVVGEKIWTLWLELSKQETLASQIANQIDKMQPLLLAIAYEEGGEAPGIAQEFYDFQWHVITHPVLAKYLADAKMATKTIK